MAEHSQTTRPGARHSRVRALDLLVAITCIGLLAAVAIPRHRDMSARNHVTEARALAHSVRSAANLGNALWKARGEPSSMKVQRGRIDIVNGYPAAGDLALLLEEPEAMNFTHTGGSWQHRGRTADRRCGVVYAPPVRGAAEPSVEVEVSGC